VGKRPSARISETRVISTNGCTGTVSRGSQSDGIRYIRGGGGGGSRSKAAKCVPVTPIGGFASGCTDRFTIQRRWLNKRSLLVRTGVGG
jgi:hypothetical protein